MEPSSNVVSTLISSQEISEIAVKNRNFSALSSLGLGVSDNKAGTKDNPAKTAVSGDANAAAARSSFASLNKEAEIQSQQLKHRLPSRLAVLSMVAQGRRMIAIDTSSHVFLSADAGKHWKSIRAPWTGRPVLVELASTEAAVSKKAVRDYPAEERSARPTNSRASSLAPVQAPVSSPAFKGEQISSLTGVVTDQTGAIVAGAKIRLMDPETGETHETISSPTGLYDSGDLEPGIYNLKVTAKGFQTYGQNGIVVNAHATCRVDIKLTIGAETQTVSVVADALAVQTDSNVVATLIAPGEPAPVFEITTDNLYRWTSTDGITWKRK